MAYRRAHSHLKTQGLNGKNKTLIGLKKTLGWAAFSLVQSHLLVTSQLWLLFPLLLSLPIFPPPFSPSFLSLSMFLISQRLLVSLLFYLYVQGIPLWKIYIYKLH